MMLIRGNISNGYPRANILESQLGRLNYLEGCLLGCVVKPSLSSEVNGSHLVLLEG